MRFLKRVLIWWRWPMAVLPLLLLAGTLIQGRLYLFVFPSASRITKYSGYVEDGSLGFEYTNWPLPAQTGWPPPSEWESRSGFRFRIADPGYKLVVAPFWAVALPPLALAVAGFRAKRRQPKPGECAGCRHPLVGATVCPECGRAAE